MFHRPESRPDNDPPAVPGASVAGLPALAPRVLLLTLLLLLGAPPALAQGAGPQRAIEQLEGCSKEERKSGCIHILTRRSVGENKQAIKAQVRGGRIIWYEYNSKSGRVRRTN